jgi:hypothetical protein
MMEAASTSETSVNFYQTTRRYNPEDNHLHTRSRENLTQFQTVLQRDIHSFDSSKHVKINTWQLLTAV